MVSSPRFLNSIRFSEIYLSRTNVMNDDVLASENNEVSLQFPRLPRCRTIINGNCVVVGNGQRDRRAFTRTQAPCFAEHPKKCECFVTRHRHQLENPGGKSNFQASLLFRVVFGDFLDDVICDHEAMRMARDQVHPVDAQKIDEYGGIRDNDNRLTDFAHRYASLRACRFSQRDELRTRNAERFSETKQAPARNFVPAVGFDRQASDLPAQFKIH